MDSTFERSISRVLDIVLQDINRINDAEVVNFLQKRELPKYIRNIFSRIANSDDLTDKEKSTLNQVYFDELRDAAIVRVGSEYFFMC